MLKIDKPVRVPVWEVKDIPLRDMLSGPWVGKILRYDMHWGKNVVPVEMITEGMTISDFKDMVVRMVTQSGDDHHIFVEDIREDTSGVFLNISTGS